MHASDVRPEKFTDGLIPYIHTVQIQNGADFMQVVCLRKVNIALTFLWKILKLSIAMSAGRRRLENAIQIGKEIDSRLEAR